MEVAKSPHLRDRAPLAVSVAHAYPCAREGCIQLLDEELAGHVGLDPHK